jgi:flagellar biosynthesis/type III secretory pathway protein FliH
VQTIAEYYVSKGVRKGMSKGLRRGLEKGLEEGLEKGLEKGRVEGRVEGLRQALADLLTRRFKKLPPRVAARLAEGDATSLQRWFDKAIDAKSIDAVFK